MYPLELYSGHVKDPGWLLWNFFMSFCIWFLSLLSFLCMHSKCVNIMTWILEAYTVLNGRKTPIPPSQPNVVDSEVRNTEKCSQHRIRACDPSLTGRVLYQCFLQPAPLRFLAHWVVTGAFYCRLGALKGASQSQVNNYMFRSNCIFYRGAMRICPPMAINNFRIRLSLDKNRSHTWLKTWFSTTQFV